MKLRILRGMLGDGLRGYLIASLGNETWILSDKPGFGTTKSAEEIGDRIVRAFNAHDELLAACEELLEYVEEERGWVDEADAEPMVMRGRAAIAKAKGETK